MDGQVKEVRNDGRDGMMEERNHGSKECVGQWVEAWKGGMHSH